MIVFDLNFAIRNPSVRNMLRIFNLTGKVSQICSSAGEIILDFWILNLCPFAPTKALSFRFFRFSIILNFVRRLLNFTSIGLGAWTWVWLVRSVATSPWPSSSPRLPSLPPPASCVPSADTPSGWSATFGLTVRPTRWVTSRSSRVIGGTMPIMSFMTLRTFSVIHRNQTCKGARFEYLTKTKCHSFDKSIYSCVDVNCFDISNCRTTACG